MSAPDTVRDLLSTEGDGAAVVSVEHEMLGRLALLQEVDRLAGRLSSLGIGPGDRVAIVLPNGPEMALALLAVMSVGCAAPLNPRYRQEEFRFYLDDLRPRALLTLAGEDSPALAAAPREVLSVQLEGRGLALDIAARVPGGAVGGGDATRPSGDDQALVLHTSGTTSRPKIVALRQRHLAGSARNIAHSLQLTEADRSLNVMPLFHIHGIMAGMLAPLSAGGALIATPGFDAFRFGRWIDELSPTYYSAVPTMHRLVLARARSRRKSTLRFARSSSAPLPPSLSRDLAEHFAVPVIEAYGMTEATHQMTSNPLPPGRTKTGSVGLPTGIEVAILSPGNELLPPGRKGQVAIRGATVIAGYENNPEANAASFTQGWFCTGDEGLLDDEGYLFLTGRLKEQINRGGEKISPLEVENALLGHPGVAEAVAFAITDDKLGEEVAAMVVPTAAGGSLTEGELRSYLGEHLAAFKIPRRVIFAAEIPKGATGKVQRVGMAERVGL